jgi:hypothetical protein
MTEQLFTENTTSVENPIPHRKPNAQTRIRKLLIQNPKLTTNELVILMYEEGYNITPMNVSSIRSGFLQNLKLLKAAGYLQELEL